MTTPQVLFNLRTLILALHLILFSKMAPPGAIQHVLSTRSIQGNTFGSYLRHGCTLVEAVWVGICPPCSEYSFRMCFKCANTNDKYVAQFKLTSTNPGSHRNDPLSHSNFAVVTRSLSIFTWSVPEAELNTLLFKLQTSCVVFKYSGNIRL